MDWQTSSTSLPTSFGLRSSRHLAYLSSSAWPPTESRGQPASCPQLESQLDVGWCTTIFLLEIASALTRCASRQRSSARCVPRSTGSIRGRSGSRWWRRSTYRPHCSFAALLYRVAASEGLCVCGLCLRVTSANKQSASDCIPPVHACFHPHQLG